MKVERKTEDKFEPITITLQTEEELSALLGALGGMCYGKQPYTRFMTELYSKLTEYKVLVPCVAESWSFIE